MTRADQEMRYIQEHGISILSYWDSDYPTQLKQCIDAPILLFSKGQIELMHTVLVNQRDELPERSANIDTTVGIHVNANFQFSVYTKPAKNLLHIELIGAKSQFTL